MCSNHALSYPRHSSRMEFTATSISHIILCVLISLTNGLVCPLVLTSRGLQTPTNIFLSSLAISDFLTGAVLVPLQLGDPALPANPYITAVVLLSGVASVCAVTFDRYVAITKPFSHAFLMKRFCRRIVASVWFTVIVTGVLPVIWRNDPSLVVHKVYLFCLCVVFVVLPFGFIFAAHFLIFKKLRRHCRQLRDLLSASSCASHSVARRTATEAKLARVVFLIALLFILGWLPVLYMTLVSGVGKFHLIPAALPDVSLFTMELSSLINPLIFTLNKPDLKRTLRRLLCWPRTRGAPVLRRTGAMKLARINSNIVARGELGERKEGLIKSNQLNCEEQQDAEPKSSTKHGFILMTSAV